MRYSEYANSETGSRWVVARGWEEGYQLSFWDDENILKLDYGDGCTTL